MNIFVTGGCGFIGSNFIIGQILKERNNILNFDKLTYAGNPDNLNSISDSGNYQFINGDIADYKLLKECIFNFKPDAIVNFAAESHVDRSIDDPMLFIQTNVLCTATLLNAATTFFDSHKNEDFRFHHISTDEVYGSLGSDGAFNENSLYRPNSPYSASKASSDHLVRAWSKTYKLPILISNCSNNYGPFQYPEKLIPLVIINCIDLKPLPIYGDGSNIRDWLYVDDHCSAIYEVLLKSEPNQTYNIGGNNEMSNIEIVTLICSALDNKIPRSDGMRYENLIKFINDRPGHDFRYAIDSSKVNTEIGWFAEETFNTGLEKTIDWYISNENWWRNLQKNN